MCTALAAESSINWKGFIYTYSIEPNERLLLDAGMSLYSLGMFRQYLSSAIQVIPVGFSSFSEVSDKMVISEHKKIITNGDILIVQIQLSIWEEEEKKTVF